MFFSLNYKQFFIVLPLVLIAVFGVGLESCFSQSFYDIKPEEIDNYLFLQTKEAENLIGSLITKLTNEWVNLETSSSATPQERAVPLILRKAVRKQVVNYLLSDLPIDISSKAIKKAIEIAQIFLAEDFSESFDRLEKESVKLAVEKGKEWLFQNQIKVSSGAMIFEYKTQKGEKKEAILQYVLIYQQTVENKGKFLIRFYSTSPIEPPENSSSIGLAWGSYYELEKDLPPFTVDIEGEAENYIIVGQPKIKIDFPETVPDLGLKPLSFWQKNVESPLKNKLKEVELFFKQSGEKISDAKEGVMLAPARLSKLLSNLKLKITQYNLFQAQIGQSLFFSNLSPLVLSPPDNQVFSESNNEEPPKEEQKNNQNSGQGGPENVGEAGLIQESIDDIKERIDLYLQEIEKMKAESAAASSSEIVEEDKKDQEEGNNLAKDIDPEKICLRGPNSKPQNNKVIINEVAWMGTVYSQNDDWIELKNVSNGEINLAGWELFDKTHQIQVAFDENDKIPAKGFYLLERTDDDTVPMEKADKIYLGIIDNIFEGIYLFDNNCQLQDQAEWTYNGWPAGDDYNKKTMERKVNLGWQTSLLPWGTPRQENSAIVESKTETPKTATSTASTSTSQQSQASSTNPEPQNNTLNNNCEAGPLVDIWYPNIQETDQEVEVTLFVRCVKDATYDVKITIEDYGEKNIFSEIYNEKEGKWQSSFYYLPEFFSGTGLEGGLIKLRIPEQYKYIDGSFLIKVKVRESGKTNYYQFSNYIDFISLYEAPLIPGGGYSEPTEPQNPSVENPKTVAINEIAWAGTKASAQDEWFELYNYGTNTVDLNGWQLVFSHATTSSTITFDSLISTTTILADSFYLIERTDDFTVSDVVADWFGSFGSGLNNGGELVELKDEKGNFIDSIDCSGGWFFGKAAPDYISMERISATSSGNDAANWANNNGVVKNGLDTDNNEILGTPKKPNSTLFVVASGSEAILSLVAAGLSDDPANNGRKIARTSNGDLFVTYYKEDKIFLAKSQDKGQTWLEISVTPDATSSQANPALAVDASDKIHLAWQGRDDVGFFQIYYSSFDGASFSRIESITASTTNHQYAPYLAIDSKDNLFLAWVNSQVLYNSKEGSWYNFAQISLISQTLGAWNSVESTGLDHISIASFSMAIDREDNLHFVWAANTRNVSSPHVLYQKKGALWGDIKSLDLDISEGQSQIAIDFENNIHIVWPSVGYWSDPDRAYRYSYINYRKYNQSSDLLNALLRLETEPRKQISSPALSFASGTDLYVIWQSTSTEYQSIHLLENNGSWRELQTLATSTADINRINPLWNLYPINLSKKTNEPVSGYAFIFCQGRDLKFYASPDLKFE